MYAKYGDAVRLDVNDEARRRARRTDCVSGVVGGEPQGVVVSVNRRGGCAAPEAPAGATTSDKESVELSSSVHQTEKDCYRDWAGRGSLASTEWFRRAGHGLRQSLVSPLKWPQTPKATMMSSG